MLQRQNLYYLLVNLYAIKTNVNVIKTTFICCKTNLYVIKTKFIRSKDNIYMLSRQKKHGARAERARRGFCLPEKDIIIF